jgi:hypothetical protein
VTGQSRNSDYYLGSYKKRSKKLLLIWFSGAPAVVRTPMSKSFLLLFFKKEALASRDWDNKGEAR